MDDNVCNSVALIVETRFVRGPSQGFLIGSLDTCASRRASLLLSSANRLLLLERNIFFQKQGPFCFCQFDWSCVLVRKRSVGKTKLAFQTFLDNTSIPPTSCVSFPWPTNSSTGDFHISLCVGRCQLSSVRGGATQVSCRSSSQPIVPLFFRKWHCFVSFSDS